MCCSIYSRKIQFFDFRAGGEIGFHSGEILDFSKFISFELWFWRRGFDVYNSVKKSDFFCILFNLCTCWTKMSFIYAIKLIINNVYEINWIWQTLTWLDGAVYFCSSRPLKFFHFQLTPPKTHSLALTQNSIFFMFVCLYANINNEIFFFMYTNDFNLMHEFTKTNLT